MAAFQSGWTVTLDAKEPPLIAPGTANVFLAARTGPLAARALADGQQIWSKDVATSIAPVVGDGLVFVAQEKTVVAYDEATGVERWSSTTGALTVPPLWRTGWLFTVNAEGEITARRATDGSVVWTQSITAPPAAPMAIDGDRLFVATADARLLSLALQASGKIEWSRVLADTGGHPFAAADRVYLGSANGTFYSIKQDNGAIDWSNSRIGFPVVGHALLEDSRVFLATFDNRLLALDRRSGAQIWWQPLSARPGEQLALDHSQLIAPLMSGDIAVLPAKTGRPMTIIAAPKGTNGVRLAAPIIMAGPVETQQLLRLTLGGDEGLTLSSYARGTK